MPNERFLVCNLGAEPIGFAGLSMEQEEPSPVASRLTGGPR